MSDLAAETRQLLDAATQGPWTRPSDTANWFTVPQPIQIDEADWGQEAQEDGAMCGYRIGTLADERAWRYADVELIAAAPRLLANWLAREDADVPSAYPDLVLQLRSLSDRSCKAAADVIEQLAAERDRLADENRALREQLDAVERLFSNDPDSSVRTTYRREWSSSNGDCMVSSQPVECAEVPLDDLRSVLAAADRGVTDGEAT